jgi:biotin transport system substrate-specific component
MTALISVTSFISVPTPIPFTLQLFGIYSALFILEGAAGVISVIIYTLLGIIGLPVFAGFSSGIGHIASPSGGFVIGFTVSAILYAAMMPLFKNIRHGELILAYTTLIPLYAIGAIWFCFFSDTRGVVPILFATIIPYVIPDIVKIFLAYFLTRRLKCALPELNEKRKDPKKWKKQK